jgi:hypothetical protein
VGLVVVGFGPRGVVVGERIIEEDGGVAVGPL